jgi:hypothetical protein
MMMLMAAEPAMFRKVNLQEIALDFLGFYEIILPSFCVFIVRIPP